MSEISEPTVDQLRQARHHIEAALASIDTAAHFIASTSRAGETLRSHLALARGYTSDAWLTLSEREKES